MKHETWNMKHKIQNTKQTFLERMLYVSRFTFHEKGFTLIELMVAMSVFAIAISASSGLFVVSLRGQQRAHVVQNLADNVRYAMETISKEVRMGSDFSSCAGSVCSFKSHMLHRDGKIVKFKRDVDTNKILFDDDTAFDDSLPITSSNIEVTDLDFELLGGSAIDQERVVIVMKARVVGNSPYASADITLQTTVSPRAL